MAWRHSLLNEPKGLADHAQLLRCPTPNQTRPKTIHADESAYQFVKGIIQTISPVHHCVLSLLRKAAILRPADYEEGGKRVYVGAQQVQVTTCDTHAGQRVGDPLQSDKDQRGGKRHVPKEGFLMAGHI